MNWLALILAIITVVSIVGIVYLIMTYQYVFVAAFLCLMLVTIFGVITVVVVSTFYELWVWVLIKWGWA